jgi:hypothetical protein
MINHAEVLPAYRQFRQIGLRLNHALAGSLSKEEIHTAGRRLGMLHNGTLVFDSEDETSVLMDYGIYNVETAGRNAVQRYLTESASPPGSDEMVLLKAMLKAYYSLYQVIDPDPGVGVTVQDVLRADIGFMADIGLSGTARKGDVFATRVIPLEEQGFMMSGGAGLPVEPEALTKIKRELSRAFGPGTDFARLTREQEAYLAALVIRNCLQMGMSSRIAYGTSAESSSPRKERSIDPREVRRANPNDACPCGSGKKFKSCCGRRPRL